VTAHDVTPPSLSQLPAQTADAVTSTDVGARAPQLASVNRHLLRLLVVEDNPADAELEVERLKAAGYECRWERVQTREEFLDRIEAAGYDLILADYALPTFDGLTALRLLRARDLDLPFILISGAIGEEVAIESLKAGATDYVLKSRLERLVPVVQRALAEREERRQRTQAEEALRLSDARYRELFENANDIVYTHDLQGNFISVNKAAERLTGFTREEARTMNVAQILVPEHLELAHQVTARQLAGETIPMYELELFSKDGRLITIEVNTRLIHEHGTPVGVQGIARDVTARKRAEAEKNALLDVAQEITGALDLKQLLDSVQRLTAKILPCDAVATFYWDPAREVFRIVAQCGIPPELLPHAEALELPRDVHLGGAPLEQSAVVINDIPVQPGWPIELHSHFPLGSLVAVPLHVHERQLGVLVGLRMTSRRGFDASEVQLCTGIARQLALALEAVELYRTQQEEAHVSGALVRVGQEFLSVLETPLLLDRLCQLTASQLQCDFSHTFLWRAEDDTFSVAAGFGDSPEQWESLRSLNIPRSILAPLLARLEGEDTVAMDMTTDPYPPVSRIAAPYGATLVLYTPLWRRHAVVGVLTAGYRSRREPFTSQQRRILGGIGQLASMALETARLFEELERANRLKSDFVATMSHELRTPLNIIMGYTDLLREGEFGSLSPAQLDPLERMDHSARNLLRLVNATLDLSRLDGGQAPIELTDVALPDLMAEVAAEAAELHIPPDLVVTWNIAPRLPRLSTDPVKLKVVLTNLIGNAVKFTPRGSVTVNVHARNGSVEISVTDTGIGIAPEVLPIIFEPFRQGDSSATRRFGGVGLGLYIVRRLVDLLGGTITVESELDHGSTFRLLLPVGRKRDRAAA
jgi:PAS domain S-box-containing protein